MPFLALLVFVIMVVALIDAITRRDDQVRHLPKFAWIIFICCPSWDRSSGSRSSRGAGRPNR
jgi:hypothetical protein